jgi:hypothetical protein
MADEHYILHDIKKRKYLQHKNPYMSIAQIQILYTL